MGRFDFNRRAEDLSRATPLTHLGGIVLAVPLALLAWPFVHYRWLPPVLVVVALLAYQWALESGQDRTRRMVAAGIIFAPTLAFSTELVSVAIANTSSPPQWDFRLYWIMGRVGALGLNFYEPEHARRLAEAFTNSKDFLSELYFWHAPPTMFLLVPLGWFDINTASLLWQLVNGVALGLDIWLAYHLFLRRGGILGLLLSATLITLLYSTYLTVYFEQTNFLVLLALLLLWMDRTKTRAGLWLVLGSFVKPVLAPLGLYLLVRRRWTALASAAATASVLLTLSALAFGIPTFLAFFLANPTHANTPSYLYDQSINQSLLAWILRATQQTDNASPANLPYLIVGAGLTALSCWLAWQRRLVSDELALALFVPLALMVYPSSLSHYGVLLVVPLAYLISQRETMPGGALTLSLLVGSIYALAGFGITTFFAEALAWLVLVGLAVRAVLKGNGGRDNGLKLEDSTTEQIGGGRQSAVLDRPRSFHGEACSPTLRLLRVGDQHDPRLGHVLDRPPQPFALEPRVLHPAVGHVVHPVGRDVLDDRVAPTSSRRRRTSCPRGRW